MLNKETFLLSFIVVCLVSVERINSKLKYQIRLFDLLPMVMANNSMMWLFVFL